MPLIGAGPGVGAAVVRRFGREGYRSTLVSRGAKLEPVAADLRHIGIAGETVGADASDVDSHRSPEATAPGRISGAGAGRPHSRRGR